MFLFMPKRFAVVRSKGHKRTHVRCLFLAHDRYSELYGTTLNSFRELKWFIKIVFTMPLISSTSESGPLIDGILTVEYRYISFGSVSKMIVIKRSSVTTSPKSLILKDVEEKHVRVDNRHNYGVI